MPICALRNHSAYHRSVSCFSASSCCRSSSLVRCSAELGCHTVEAPGLAHGARPLGGELLFHLVGKPGNLAEIEILRQHCSDAGRDQSQIEPYGGSWLVVRETKAEAEGVLAEIAKHHPGMNRPNAFVGNVDAVAAHLKRYWDVGIRGYIVGFAHPFDMETMKRLAEEVRPRLERLVGIAA